MINFIKKIFSKPIVGFWIYGTCRNQVARKHKIKGNVQFVLWKAGEQGQKEDYWHNFDSSHYSSFKPNN